jgi:hypothetical protein
MSRLGKNISAYSKMYLVTPSVYEKLLTCIDNKDKRTTEELNFNPENAPERPSERAVQDLSNVDIDVQADPIVSQPASEIRPLDDGDDLMANNESDFYDQQNVSNEEIVSDETPTQLNELQQLPQQETQQQDPQTPMKNSSGVYECPFCHKIFKRPFIVNRHIERYHARLKIQNITEEPLQVVSTLESDPGKIKIVKTKPAIAYVGDSGSSNVLNPPPVNLNPSSSNPIPGPSNVQPGRSRPAITYIPDDDFPMTASNPNTPFRRVPKSSMQLRKSVSAPAQEMFYEDGDGPLNIAPAEIRKKCVIGSDNTKRCIPNLVKPSLIKPYIPSILKPELRKKLKSVVKNPNLKSKKNKGKTLATKLTKKKTDLKSQSVGKKKVTFKKTSKRGEQEMDVGEFDDWTNEANKTKTRSRTATEANLRQKPAKWIPGGRDIERWNVDN